jgi:hypothetical protein
MVQSSITNTASSKVADMYLDLFTLREMPISEAAIERLAKEVLEWPDISKKQTMTEFFKKKGISSATFWRWTQKFPILKEAYEQAMQYLGDNREAGAAGFLKRKLDPTMIKPVMFKYSEIWRELRDEDMALKKQLQNDTSKNITIVMEDFSKKGKNESTSRDSDLSEKV